MASHRRSFDSLFQVAARFMMYITMQNFGRFPILKAQEIVFDGDSYVQETISINLNYSVFTVSEKFLSVAIDANIMREHWHGVDFNSEKLFTLAAALSPSFLRIGGTSADFLIYDGSTGQERAKNFTDFNITHEDLDKIHLLSSKAGWDVMFGLNVLLRGKDGSWDSSNAKKIMQYVADHDYRFGWELGNEPTHFKEFNKTLSSEDLANDFQLLRGILRRNPQFGSFLVGPDIGRIFKNHSKREIFLKSFIQHAKDAIDAVTWHQYYVDGRSCSEGDFYNPRILDYLLHELNTVNYIMKKYDPGAPRWLGETSSAYGGGAPGLSDRYVAGFMWLDKLGLAARLRHEVVIRQSFLHGHYSLLDDDLNPNPDYWLSLLYKRLVGENVLEVYGGTEEARKVRVYAHCSSRKYPSGSITLLALNVNVHDPVELKLTGGLQGKDIEEYLLMATNGDLTSKSVTLNGRVLELVNDHTLPDLVPARTSKPIILPPLSFGLYVIPGAAAKACI
ncbi:heparanase-like isoform X2 [Montipora foliosa]|uniref:heparanase-like isoform X2 n=1 Tax=Montipora foliosa TaxID=591990 RepID=UPI0035F133F8